MSSQRASASQPSRVAQSFRRSSTDELAVLARFVGQCDVMRDSRLMEVTQAEVTVQPRPTLATQLNVREEDIGAFLMRFRQLYLVKEDTEVGRVRNMLVVHARDKGTEAGDKGESSTDSRPRGMPRRLLPHKATSEALTVQVVPDREPHLGMLPTPLLRFGEFDDRAARRSKGIEELDRALAQHRAVQVERIVPGHMSVQENPWSVRDGDVDGMAELARIAIDLLACSADHGR